MSETTTKPVGYGYASDEQKISPFNFGLNAGAAKMTKFEWIPNGGKGGVEQEALDIVFNINGTDKNYRMFPVTKAFLKGNAGETTDPNAPEFQEAISDFNSVVTHILHAFIESDAIKAGLARPIANFKEFCQIVMSLLPKSYTELPLDIFMQYQWNLPEGKERTYLDIPSKMKYGKWLVPAQPGTWIKHLAEGISEDTKKALWYTNEKGEEHPFFKNGWFMNSNFANQQKSGSSDASEAASTATAVDGEKKKSAW